MASDLDRVLAALQAHATGDQAAASALPAWAVAYQSDVGRWVLTEPAMLLLELAARTVDLRALQAELLAWATATYGEQTMERRGLVIAEEAGEIARVVLKTAERTRPSTRGKLGVELVQLVVAILVTAELAGVDVTATLPVVIQDLKTRAVEREARA